MISEEKMTHIVHLMIDGIWKADLVDYSDEDLALREAKRAANQYIQAYESVSEIARKRITSQKSPPQEHTQQWEILFNKYCEEELNKKGG